MNLLLPTERIELKIGETITFNQVTGNLPVNRIEGDFDGKKVTFDNEDTDLEATNTEDAIKEVNSKVNEKADASSLAEVATSGSYNDLTDKPTIPEQAQSDWNEADNTKPDYIKNKPALSTVATSGNYNDLSNKPTIPPAQVNSDWNADSGVSQILNKPNLATVATSGNYNDLSNKPSIPAAQVNSDWNSNSGVSKILNKPNLSTVATTGNYDDLNNKPSIPVIDDTTKVADKVWSSKKTYDEIVAILPTGNASGSIANFNTSLALPLVSAKFGIVASGGGGTPSTPIPIVGVSAVNVVKCGKNFFNPNDIILGNYVSNKWTLSTPTGKALNLKFKPNTVYTFSGYEIQSVANKYVRLDIVYTDNSRELMFSDATTSGNNFSKTSSSSKSIDYIALNYASGGGSVDISNFQIEIGSIATDYEPYNGSTTLINLGGTYYGGEVVKDSNGTKLRVTHGFKTFKGDETFIASTDNRFFYTVDDVVQPTLSVLGMAESSHFAPTTQSQQNDKSIWKTTSNKVVVFKDTSIADLTAWTNFLTTQYNNGTPVQLKYQLATPIEIALTDIGDIVTLVGENNIFADSGNSEVTYKKSIDDAIAELQALILG